MTSELAAFRVYPSTPESVESLNFVDLNEVHIVLAFARDYDATGIKYGKFVPYFNPNFTPEWIRKFKNKSEKFKVFLSIGGRNAKYPFYIPSGKRDEWVTNATHSLKDIVNNYGFDGIDVYYEHVTSKSDFPKAMWDVIWKLRSSNERVIARASLTVSAGLNHLYESLYQDHSEDFDHVVYQSHSVTTPIPTCDKLVNIFDELTYEPKIKIFAGHSFLPSDWKYVPIPIIRGAIPKLLEHGIVSISEWAVTDHDPET